MSVELMNKKVTKLILFASVLAMMPLAGHAETDTLVKSGKSQNNIGRTSQKKIDQISEQTDKIISKYHQQRKSVEQLRVYNDQMRRRIKAQENEMINLQNSIEEASLIERQIVPLMISMVGNLERYIKQDMPFQRTARLNRVNEIKGFLTNANVSASERMRQVLAEYKNETSYGNSVNVYTETINSGGVELVGNILQVGRVALYFQTLDGTDSKIWNKKESKWDNLDSGFNEGIMKAIKITQGKVSSDLMELPIESPTKL